MDKRKGYVLLLINAGVRNSVSEREKSRRLLHYVQWHPVITLGSKRTLRVLLLELSITRHFQRNGGLNQILRRQTSRFHYG